MTKPSIRIRNLHKKFSYGDPSNTFKDFFLNKIGRKQNRVVEKELYSGLDLEIHKGETVAFLGKNGSGKSTLLKIIAGIYQPDEGEVVVRGSLGALIELGAGFHPEFKGRENAILYGQILGLTKDYMLSIIEEIKEFSELNHFFEQPVKNYSSGMYMRLAFSTSIFLDPDILIIDEILSVGDLEFARKCKLKMDEFKTRDKTICLVSHDLATVEDWATRVVILNKGRLVFDGNPTEAIDIYKNRVTTKNNLPVRNQQEEGKNLTDFLRSEISPLLRSFDFEIASQEEELVICISSAFDFSELGYQYPKISTLVDLLKTKLSNRLWTKLTFLIFHSSKGMGELKSIGRDIIAKLQIDHEIKVQTVFQPQNKPQLSENAVFACLDWPSLGHILSTIYERNDSSTLKKNNIFYIRSSLDQTEWPNDLHKAWLESIEASVPYVTIDTKTGMMIPDWRSTPSPRAYDSIVILSDADLVSSCIPIIGSLLGLTLDRLNRARKDKLDLYLWGAPFDIETENGAAKKINKLEDLPENCLVISPSNHEFFWNLERNSLISNKSIIRYSKCLGKTKDPRRFMQEIEKTLTLN